MSLLLCFSCLSSISSFVTSLFSLWFSLSCFWLFLIVFSSFLKFCGVLALRKCGLLSHLSLEILPNPQGDLVKERNFFFVSFLHFLSFRPWAIFRYITCFSNYLFIVFCVCLIIWIIFLVVNPLNNILLKKLS